MLNSTYNGGDLWIADSDMTDAQRTAILALEDRGARPQAMTLGGWLGLTDPTRTTPAPAMDRGTQGVSVPCCFRAAVLVTLAGDVR
jgi:hypothetical protein